jgi:circadian clock protein KaiB
MKNMGETEGSGNEETYVMTLYITGMSIGSIKAIENIKSICEQFLKGRYDLNIIDVHKFPNSMFENNIIASPTLIKTSPAPIKKLIGDLSDREKVLRTLSINQPNQ